MSRPLNKVSARKAARARRARCSREGVGAALISHFPFARFAPCAVAGFAPLPDEIDLWPLLKVLQRRDYAVGLPVTGAPDSALSFRAWTPDTTLSPDRFNVLTPPADSPLLIPTLILVPLLAFTPRGDRLGYGGGYYDRTLAALRSRSDVYACGVGFAAQETADLPTGPFDQRLDGVLTETYFTDFT